MRNLTRRISRMQERVETRAREAANNIDLIIQTLVCSDVEQRPILRRVIPEDTDPETYKKIQIDIAYTDGDFARARQLRGVPRYPVWQRPVRPEDLDPEELDKILKERAYKKGKPELSNGDDRPGAVEAACRRLNMDEQCRPLGTAVAPPSRPVRPKRSRPAPRPAPRPLMLGGDEDDL